MRIRGWPTERRPPMVSADGRRVSCGLEDLCLIGLSVTFGCMCVVLCCWQKQMLALMLAPRFHFLVLASGLALIGIAFLRAIILFSAIPNEWQCKHFSFTDEWTPWRYPVFLVPVILFILHLPRTGAATPDQNAIEKSLAYATLVGTSG